MNIVSWLALLQFLAAVAVFVLFTLAMALAIVLAWDYWREG